MRFSFIKDINNLKYLIYFMILSIGVYFINSLFLFYLNMKRVNFIPLPSETVQTPFGGERDNSHSFDSSIIIKRNLFGVIVDENEELDRKNLIASLENLNFTSLNLTLIGTIVGEEGKAWAIIKDNQTGKADRYEVGADIGRAKVVMILRNKVVLNVDGRNELLVMGIEKMRSEGSETEGQLKKEKGRFVISRGFLEQNLNNITKLMAKVRISPYIKNGKPAGFMIRKIESGSIFEKMGFKEGDIIRGINGARIVSAQDIMKLYGSMKNASIFSVEILRNNRPRTLVFKVQ